MDRHLGNRLLIGHCSIALVIVLSAVTALVALGSTIRRAERTREIEARLALVRELRADARELAQSARRFLLSGNSQDRQRVFAIDAELRRERDALRARSSYPAGWVADLAEYSATLTTAMSRATDDIETVAHFEDELMRVRNALEVTLDGIVAGERAKLGDLQSSTAFVRRAQWALAGASLLGLVLVVVMGVYVFRLHARRLYSSSLAPGGSGTPPFTSDSSPDSLDSLADPSVEPTHLR
ncbi:MAG: hypothetical protein HOV81_24900 [Kofleriaceae bacterium]|nr:hypothetical protein [Kofleriaceae bacterium]